MNKLRFVTCIILLCYSILNAQNNQLYFEQSTTANGLSQNTVISICQDSIRFLWFGTYNGLNRYDGYNLDLGKYKFKVKTSNHDGVWNKEGKTLTIRIKPPFWETWWFRIVLYFSIFVATPLLIIYYWRERIEAHHEKTKREDAKRTVGRIAHELGTPISEMSISLYGLHEKLPVKFAHYLYAIENAAERIQAIMQAMREIKILEDSIKGDLLKIDSSAESKLVSVNYLLQTAIMAVKETRDEAVNFSIQYSSNTRINCYPNEIIQIFINLLRNSYDAFRPDEKGKRKGTIIVKSNNIENVVQVVIQDNGEGISENIKGSIFKEGFSTRSGVGRGFGLTIAKHLVEKNKGKLEIKNNTINENISGCIAIVEFPKAVITDISE